MELRTIIGVCMILGCILIGYQRNFILEMEHTLAVDTAFYSGMLAGAMMIVSVQLITKRKKHDTT